MFQVPIEMAADLERELRRGWQMGRVRAEVESKQAAALNQIEHRAMDGIGQLRMRVPLDAYHFWGQKLGYDCWNDKQFLHEFERDNPAVKVKSAGGTKLQFGYQASTASAKKFSKSYGSI